MVFSGDISLDGGGFSSIRRSFSSKDLSGHAGVVSGSSKARPDQERQDQGRRAEQPEAAAVPQAEDSPAAEEHQDARFEPEEPDV